MNIAAFLPDAIECWVAVGEIPRAARLGEAALVSMRASRCRGGGARASRRRPDPAACGRTAPGPGSARFRNRELHRIGARPWEERARGELARIGVRRAPEMLTENERRVCEPRSLWRKQPGHRCANVHLGADRRSEPVPGPPQARDHQARAAWGGVGPRRRRVMRPCPLEGALQAVRPNTQERTSIPAAHRGHVANASDFRCSNQNRWLDDK